jgi:hypothetical protein
LLLIGTSEPLLAPHTATSFLVFNEHMEGDGETVGTPAARRIALDVDLGIRRHEDRTPTHGYAVTREAAMAAFAKSWRRD